MDKPALYEEAVKGRHSSHRLTPNRLLFLVQGVNANAAKTLVTTAKTVDEF